MKGLDFVLANMHSPIGSASPPPAPRYGGYMIDWLASHSKGRFRALVSHAGVYNLTSMYGSTEELWFPERDFGGMPWTIRRNVPEVVAPHLCGRIRKIQNADARHCGEQDYRVPYTQSLEFFHGPATARCAFKAGGVPRRGTLDPQTAKQPAVVQRSARLARKIPGHVAGRGQTI